MAQLTEGAIVRVEVSEDPVCHSGDELDVEVVERLSDENANTATLDSPKVAIARTRGHRGSYSRKAIIKSAARANEATAGSDPECSRPTSGLLHPDRAEESRDQRKEMSSVVDWSEQAIIGEHLWQDISSSTDFCYVGEADCTKQGGRKRCSACRIVAHLSCVPRLEQMNFRCRQTYREAGIGSREYLSRHHWVHRRRQDGKCKECSKSFQQKFVFHSNKEIIAIACSWCKVAFHNKGTCFRMEHIHEICNMGALSSAIVPPSWIIRLPRKQLDESTGSFKNTTRRRSVLGARRSSSSRRRRSRDDFFRPFVVKPVPGSLVQPILVFINPKSGGNQGSRLLQTFQWLLNPRQVFDLSEGGPKPGLELYRRVPQLRVLACGGDGTVGWILSVFDTLNIAPPVAILPLGTGNDLARTLNWGGGYADEPLLKVLKSVQESPVVQLDRWDISVTPNRCSYSGCEEDSEREASVAETLPLQVMNNYFSLGADAHVALEFHESREANPEKFNSRLRNKMFYAGAGGKDFVKRSWKGLSEHVKLICDGVDLTPRIQELKLHCLLFLNIPRYCGGTLPWGSGSSNFEAQKHDDGSLEIIGFTYSSLATLQVGGHGNRLCQCSTVELHTTKPIPMQVDGEPCRLQPAIIKVSLRNQANMVFRAKRRGSIPIINDIPSQRERLRLQVSCVTRADYEQLVFNKQQLRATSVPVGIVVVETDSDLKSVRKHIQRLREDVAEAEEPTAASNEWCFLDSTTADRLYRIDRSQEHINYVTDISSEDIYIMELTDTQTIIKENLETKEHLLNDGEFTLPATPPCSPYTPSLIVTNDRLATAEGASVASEQGHAADQSVQIELSKSDTKSEQCVSSSKKHTAELERNKNATFLETSIDQTSAHRSIDKLVIDASKRGDFRLFQKLHTEGARLDAVDHHGMTPLHHAARFGHRDIVSYIIMYGTKELLDQKDFEKQQTALHKAAWYHRRTICYLLLQAGASLTIKDHKGYTPRMQAVEAKDKELAAYLESQEHFQIVVSENQETAV